MYPDFMKIEKPVAAFIVAVTLVLAGLGVRATYLASAAKGGNSNNNNANSAQAPVGEAATTSAPQGANSGAIYTTTAAGGEVNANIYETRDQVYLGGGPQNRNCGSSGLTDGEYYFQVTDPSGNMLLSTDVLAERRVQVTGGLISAYLGTTHLVGVGPCSSVSVGLEPYNDTANAGGQFKVWMTSVANYSAGQGNFGFSNNDSKTDSFKVLAAKRAKTSGVIRGRVFRDATANGVDDGDPSIAGFEVTLKGGSVAMTQLSDAGGYYVFQGVPAGTYEVCQVIPQHDPAWQRTAPTTTSGCHTVALAAGQTVDYLNFGNVLLANVGGHKFLDANLNGSDDGEELLAGFTIMLSGRTVNGKEIITASETDATGSYIFKNMMPGEYRLCETAPTAVPAWRQISPVACHDVSLSQGDEISGKDFGNIQLVNVSGNKYDDHDADGIRDSGEEGVGNVVISLSGASVDSTPVSLQTQTDENGNYTFDALLPGSYTICETVPSGSSPAWFQTAPEAGCHSITAGSGDLFEGMDFGNIKLAELYGKKFYDANVNGLDDDGAVIPSWVFTLKGTAINGFEVLLSSITDALGRVSFTGLLPGSYTVTETIPVVSGAKWVATTPTSVTEARAEGQLSPDISFGNVCVGAGGAESIGYWQSPNGEARIAADDLAALTALRLRTSAGGNFDPATYASFKTWITGATSTNMAYMLSAQLAAAKLSVLNGLASGSRMIQATGAKGANSVGFMTLDALMAEADAELALHGSTSSGSAYRAYQEVLKNILDAVAKNSNFVQPSAAACGVNG